MESDHLERSLPVGEAATEKEKHSSGDTVNCWNKPSLKLTLSLDFPVYEPMNSHCCLNQFGYLLLVP